MSGPVESFEENYLLGVPVMDETHREFVDLVNRLTAAGNESFAALFAELVRHTEAHFEAENMLMQATGFPAIREHMDEHRRVLGDLMRMQGRVDAGSAAMARAYVREQIPDWFSLHALTMDSALAAHIKARTAMPDIIAHGPSGLSHPE